MYWGMTTTNTMTATPKKLNDGNWGALVKDSTVRPGDTIQITTRAGKTWAATVTSVFSTSKWGTVCATKSASKRTTRSTTRSYSHRGYGSRYGSGHGSAALVPGYSKYCTDNASCGCYDCAS